MKTKVTTLTNNFHGTSCRVYIKDVLGFSQVKRVWKNLCGQDNCACKLVYQAIGPEGELVDWGELMRNARIEKRSKYFKF